MRNENPFVCLFDLFIFRFYVLWPPNAIRLFLSLSVSELDLLWVESLYKQFDLFMRGIGNYSSSVFNERAKEIETYYNIYLNTEILKLILIDF